MQRTVVAGAVTRQPHRDAAEQQKITVFALDSSRFDAIISSLDGRVLTTLIL
jgi:hypothetical protein